MQDESFDRGFALDVADVTFTFFIYDSLLLMNPLTSYPVSGES